MTIDIKKYMRETGQAARTAAGLMARADSARKNRALTLIAAHIRRQQATLGEANAADIEAAKARGLDSALVDRLALTGARIEAMAEGLCQIAALPDPVGAIGGLAMRPNGLQIGKMRVPLGVVGVIYESRPNVTADVAGLCLKSGNAAILRGGSEAARSNRAIADCVRSGLAEAGLPASAVQVLATTDRAAVGELLRLPEYVDVIIPRGGKGLIERVGREAQMPVIKHLDGVCHVYIDAAADIEKAVKIAHNAKTQRYGACNTMESLLIAEALAGAVLDRLLPLYREVGVETRGCAASARLYADIKPATAEDYATEYLAPILSLKIVADLDEAMRHIARFGSRHTDAIVTEDLAAARRFLREVDSSSVMVNASTRFADGFEYGLGAEVGISTDKFHARGPVGLEGLTSEKYIVLGDGHIRA